MSPEIILIKQQYLMAKQELETQFWHALEQKNNRSSTKFLGRHTKLINQVLTQLWQLQQINFATLIAVGGFGREELFPHSDVDFLVLVTQESDFTASRQEKVSSFVQSCWDIGLRIGSSVRTLTECRQQVEIDLVTQTSFLEHHYICGDKKLYQAFRKEFTKVNDVLAFCYAKQIEQKRRHTKYNNTAYALEPNCKFSVGGLRDLHVLRWCSLAAGFGGTWQELEIAGLLTKYEVGQLRQSLMFLQRLRFVLHLLAKREEDRVLFDWQDKLAQLLGYKGEHPQQRTEMLMQHYYRAVTNVVLINKIAWLNIFAKLRPSTSPRQPIVSRIAGRLTKNFYKQDNLLEIVSDDLYEKQPRCILQTFYLLAVEPDLEDLSARTLRSLNKSHQLVNRVFRSDNYNQQLFIKILQTEKVFKTLRLMNRTSILGKYLPEFYKVVGRMQHDLYHIYTVDQHSLQAVANMQRFFMPEYAHEYPLAAEIAARFYKPWLMIVAALYHDVGKGRGGDHSQIGAKLVAEFAERHDLDRADTKLLVFLVEQHLTMSVTAQKADLENPQVIRDFVRKVRTPQQLDSLYLLTIADIRATSPHLWNTWKQMLLNLLYHKAAALQTGSKLEEMDVIEKNQQYILTKLEQQQPEQDIKTALTQFWQQLRIQYFIRHDVETMLWHASCLANDYHRPQVKIRQHQTSGSWQVLVYVPDQSRLFAQICTFFARHSLSILDARIHTTKHAFCLDTFFVMPAVGVSYSAEAALELEQQLLAFLQSSKKVKTPLYDKKISRRGRYFPLTTKIKLSPDEKGEYWLLSVKTYDRVGLLRDLAEVLHRHNIGIQLAKIMTMGERVEDSFLIHGEVLLQNDFRLKLEQELGFACEPSKRDRS